MTVVHIVMVNGRIDAVFSDEELAKTHAEQSERRGNITHIASRPVFASC